MNASTEPESTREIAPWQRVWRVAGPLLAALAVMLTCVTLSPSPAPPAYEADRSLNAVLNYAHQQGLQYGPEVIFTYGPLGFLIFPYYYPYAAGLRMVTDVLLGYAVALGLCLLAWRMRVVWALAVLAVFVLVCANIHPRTDLVLNLGLLFWGLLCLLESGRPVPVYGVVLTLLAAFVGLAKVSLLVVGGLTVGAVAIDLWLREKRLVALVLPFFYLLFLLAGWLASGQSLWHLKAFLVNATAIVQSYNQTVAMEGLAMLTPRGAVIALLALAAVVLRGWTAFRRGDWMVGWRRAIWLPWLAAFVLMAWKHSFLRADPWHMLFMLGFVPVLALVLEALPAARPATLYWARGFGLAAALLSLATVQTSFMAAGFGSLLQPARALAANARWLTHPAEYWRQMNDAFEAARNEAQLPRLRRIIGRAKVDVFAQHQSYAIFNELNYRPRPVFQSYGAATAELARLNEQFYLSPAAPEYVLFGLYPIDRRFPPLEDAAVLRDLLFNYEPVAAEHPFLLLKSRSDQTPQLRLLRDNTVRPGEPIDLRIYGSADLWLQLELKPTWLGRLREFFFRPAKVRLAAWRAPSQGQILKQPAPAPMLAAGFVASPLLANNDDVLDAYASNPVTRPGAYSVELNRGEEIFWQPEIQCRVYQIENRLGRCTPAEVARELKYPGFQSAPHILSATWKAVITVADEPALSLAGGGYLRVPVPYGAREITGQWGIAPPGLSAAPVPKDLELRIEAEAGDGEPQVLFSQPLAITNAAANRLQSFSAPMPAETPLRVTLRVTDANGAPAQVPTCWANIVFKRDE